MYIREKKIPETLNYIYKKEWKLKSIITCMLVWYVGLRVVQWSQILKM